MNIQFDPEELRPVVEACLVAVLEKIEPIRAQFGGKLLHSEPESAAILGLKPAHLGELRRNGTVPHQQLGGRVFYSNQDILQIAGMGRD